MSMPRQISCKMVKARKKYRCNYSYKTIEIGDTYEHGVYVYDGDIYSFIVHQEAKYIIDKLDMYGKGTDNDGFSDSDYDNLLDDYLYDNKLYDEWEKVEDDISLHDFVYKHLKAKEDKEK